MKESSKKRKCEKCGSSKTYRDFKEEKQKTFIPKTIGHLADVNGDKFSEDKKQSLSERK